MMNGYAGLGGAGSQSTGSQEALDEEQRLQEARREANRLHCKQTRDRRRQRERELLEEVEILTLYQTIVEDGPELFSLHRRTADAPFSYLSENFFTRLQLAPEQLLGSSLCSIVHPRDVFSLQTAICGVLNQAQQQTHLAHHPGGAAAAAAAAGGGGYGGGFGGGGAGTGSCGSTIRVHVIHGEICREASMSLAVGSHGLVVVTRLYDS